MTEPRDDVTDAMQRLRGAVRDQILPPPAALLRARAARARRVRRTGTAVLAASAVAALAIGAAQVVDLAAPPPVPPAETPHPTASPSPAASPLPPPLPGVDPSPRAAPLAAAELDAPITRLDWAGPLVVTVPPRPGCPTGPVQVSADNPGGSTLTSPLEGPYPGLAVSLVPGGGDRVAYGDVTGDGRVEAVIDVNCFSSPESLGSGHGWQLLVVALADDGTLPGLGWVGPSHANIQAVWVADGQVLMDGDPWTAGPDDHFPALPGLALSYRWDGSQFVGWELAADYPPLLALEADQPGAPVRPGAVATALGCPDQELRFTQEGTWGGTATAGGVTFTIPDRHHPAKQHLFDLDNTGQRLLVTALACTAADGWTREGIAVFERSGDGWRGISVLPPIDGYGTAVVSYWSAGPDGTLYIHWDSPTPESYTSTRYRWTGTRLVPTE